MTVNQVRSLLLTYIANAIDLPMVRALSRVFNEPAVSCLCRRPWCSRMTQFNSQVPPTSGHTCLSAGQRGVTFDIQRTLRNSSFGGSSFRVRSLALRLHSQLAARRQAWWPRRTPQPTSSERTAQRAQHPRGIFPLLWPVSALASSLGSLDRRAIMSSLDTLPGESNGTSSRPSSTWSVHNAVEECRNSNVRGDAGETGLQNGNGRIRRREAPSLGASHVPGRRVTLRSRRIRS